MGGMDKDEFQRRAQTMTKKTAVNCWLFGCVCSAALVVMIHAFGTSLTGRPMNFWSASQTFLIVAFLLGMLFRNLVIAGRMKFLIR